MDAWTVLFVFDTGAICALTLAACCWPHGRVRTSARLAELDQADAADVWDDEVFSGDLVDDDAEQYGRHAATPELADAWMTSPPRSPRQRACARPTAGALPSVGSRAFTTPPNARQA
jgi:hypothetical protein